MNNKFTVIINTYPHEGRKKELSTLLHSLIKQTYPFFTVLIVENGKSIQEIHPLIKKFHQLKIHVIASSDNRLSILFNHGWKNAKTELIAYVADDTKTSPHWLENMNEILKDPLTAVVTGPVLSTCYPVSEMHRLYLKSQKSILLKIVAWPYHHFAMEDRITKPGNLFESGAYSIGAALPESVTFERQRIDLATTTNMGIKKSILKKINGFDENFLFNHADGDLFIRIKKLGYSIVFDPQIIVHHYVRVGPSRNATIIGRDTGRWYQLHIRPQTIHGYIGMILNLLFLNGYWIYLSIQTKNISHLKGIPAFFYGLFLKENKK